MTTQMSSTQFDQDTGSAKEAAERGPVSIAEEGRPAHVLLTYAAYERLAGPPPISDLLAQPPGIGDIDFFIPTCDEVPCPASFE